MNFARPHPADTPTLTLNGAAVAFDPRAGERLSDALRRLGALDVKVGCNAGDCGACTVLLDAAPVCACLVHAQEAEGRVVTSLAGLRETPEVRRLADAFHRNNAAQCGICTPGMLVSAAALLQRTATPTPNEVEDALAGVLCRCTGYRAIVDAVLDVVRAPPEADGVGAGVARVDGRAKVDGTERFGDDVAPPGALALRVVRSPFPRARIILGDRGDLAAFAARPGIVAVLTAADVPGLNRFGVIPPFADQPVFAVVEARYRGEAVAAVVGEADAVAALDLAEVPVTFERLVDACSPDAAEAPGAPILHPARHGNLMCEGLVRRGDAEAALARAAVVAHGRFRSPFVEHAYIEPEAGYAAVVDGRVEVHASTQAPVMDRDGLAEILGLAPEAVRIVPTACGGGFGSKLDLSIQPFLAIAALGTGRPVRAAYTRTESMQATTKRHPSDIVCRIGAAADGTICGFDFVGTFDTGAYASWGPTVANRVPVHASGPYAIAHYRARSRAIHTHNPPSGAFRGFGVPQSAIAQEVLFDDLALALGMDRLAFRRHNALANGVATVCGQVFAQGVGIGACFAALEPHWSRALGEAGGTGPVRRGVGIAAGWYGCGNTSMPNPSTIRAGIRCDGTIVLHQGAVDIGQGSNTVIAQIFATTLGVPLAAVEIVGPDTAVTPDAGKTSASRQTFVSGNAARLTAQTLRAAVLRLANAGDDARIIPGDGLVVEDRGRRQRIDLAATDGLYALEAAETYDPPTAPLDADGQGAPYAVYGYAAHMVELDVDMELGTVTLVKVTAAHDVGRAINPVLVDGQIHGGVAQGAGMALMEEYIPGRTENLHDYLIPTIGDIPPIETLIVEEPDAHGPYGAKGLGEHALIPTAPAILNAIRHASGARLTAVPATPDRVLAAIRAAREAERGAP
ncbi:molybdopterin cofactor-binding domain-containing protein [Acuticoccus sp. I52.16.1]|uniref:molybdopterin-dependent oxidoreductase n=1 Tax=Acuticoccus sp. I52.16.1 TaxID=2928472 RepID=UPI001FD1D4F8|nr:molybdopterin cofactor-binding domain-containing protein [Acuticoccus sp. I52.16.1]UOM35100.1 molybdopterin-dependent oxidoreductase [Acuticoccus sp. I52.16.1]